MGLEEKEIWKDVKGYEGYYKISNLGNVKSLDRFVKGMNNSKRLLKGKIKPLQNHPHGYYQIRLSKNGNSKTFKTYQLVAYNFLNYEPKKGYVIDHIDNDPKNNFLDNLQIITHKQNTRKDKENLGLSFHKASNKWRRYKYIDNKQISLGYFNTKEDALNYGSRR